MKLCLFREFVIETVITYWDVGITLGSPICYLQEA